MEEMWAKLVALHITINPEGSKRNSDKEYAKTLMATRENEEWHLFYQALDALERGCGYPDCSEWETLCQNCVSQDSRRVLQIIEQKQGMLEMVILLHCVPRVDRFKWIDDALFSGTDTLFEILRQFLSEVVLENHEQVVIVAGLCQLLNLDSNRFRYLFQHYLLNNQRQISIVTKLMAGLSKEGWKAVSKSVSFNSLDSEKLAFWDQCGRQQDWKTIYCFAEPLTRAWTSFISVSIADKKFGMSLYNNLSNIIINILLFELNSYKQFFDMLNKYVCEAETAMYRWYEGECQQRGVLLACMSVVEHLRFVWINNKKIYKRSFPDNLRSRILCLMKEFRFLWDTPTLQKTKKEMSSLQVWIETVA